MSKVTKRKHVMKEIQVGDFDPPGPNQQIVRILGSRGNNLHEVESAEPIACNGNAATTNESLPESGSEQFLVSMPTKFRKNVWVKRGDFVIVDPIDEGDKVKAEIVRILTPQHIKEFTKDGIWPKKFTTKNNNYDDSSNSSDDELFKNTNRAHQYNDSNEDDDDESDDEDASDDEDESEDDESDEESDEEESSDKKK